MNARSPDSPAPRGPGTLRYPLPAAFVREVQTLFDLQGYILLEGALNPTEVASLRDSLASLPLPERGDFRPLIGESDSLLALADHPRILPYVLALLGGAIQVAASCATIVPPGAGPMVWHEDGPRPWSYPAVNDRRALVLLRVGVYLEDLTEPRRGQLVVVPGSHHVAFHRAERPELLEGQGAAKPLRVPAGSIVLFHNALWHSTAPNERAHPRVAIYLAYSPTWHRVIDYLLPPEAWIERANAQSPESRRPLLRQLLGCQPGSGSYAWQFPTPEEFPGLSLVEPEHPASGA